MPRRPHPRRRPIVADLGYAPGYFDLRANAPPGNRTNAGERGFRIVWRGVVRALGTDPDRYANANETGPAQRDPDRPGRRTHSLALRPRNRSTPRRSAPRAFPKASSPSHRSRLLVARYGPPGTLRRRRRPTFDVPDHPQDLSE